MTADAADVLLLETNGVIHYDFFSPIRTNVSNSRQDLRVYCLAA